MNNKPKKLVLSNGQEFVGTAFGADGVAAGEIIFNTSMVGYQEVISDPAYEGKIVVLTYPLIGQYGIIDEDSESRASHLAALVVGDICDTPSNFRYTKTLGEEMEDRAVSCISGLDTRMLTKIIRTNPGLKAAVVPVGTSRKKALELMNTAGEGIHPVRKVSCTKRWYSRTPEHRYDVVVLDCGLKKSTVEALNRRGCNVTVVPFDSTAAEVMAFNPDGILLSSGPGDASELKDLVAMVKKLIGKVPVAGEGLGHEIIALACGAGLEKLPCGRHGGAAVRNVRTSAIVTVEMNNDFVVKAASVKKTGLEISWTDVIDGTVQGLESSGKKICTVQFCPEGGPGPEETPFFDNFVKMMED